MSAERTNLTEVAEFGNVNQAALYSMIKILGEEDSHDGCLFFVSYFYRRDVDTAIRELDGIRRPTTAARISYIEFSRYSNMLEGERMRSAAPGHRNVPLDTDTPLYRKAEYWGILTKLLYQDVALSEPRLSQKDEDLIALRQADILVALREVNLRNKRASDLFVRLNELRHDVFNDNDTQEAAM